MQKNEIRQCILEIYKSLQKYGYNPINQIIGYLMSGDPTYITAKEQARFKIQKLDREEVLEEIVRYHIEYIMKKQQIADK